VEKKKMTKKSEEYEIIKKLGKGAQGIVYLANKKKEQKEVAIKKVICDGLDDANQYIQEGSQVVQLKHKNLVEYLDFYLEPIEEDMFFCTVMPVYSKGDLEKYITSNNNLTELDFVDLFIEIINGIDYLHEKNIIHRDLKPENVFMTEEDNKMSIKIGDFGLSTNFSLKKSKQTYCGKDY
jgi:serine/threonine protein kinase